ncbi:MAG: hypothetical protein ACE5FN_09195 [Leptospirillia bacterium]
MKHTRTTLMLALAATLLVTACAFSPRHYRIQHNDMVELGGDGNTWNSLTFSR